MSYLALSQACCVSSEGGTDLPPNAASAEASEGIRKRVSGETTSNLRRRVFRSQRRQRAEGGVAVFVSPVLWPVAETLRILIGEEAVLTIGNSVDDLVA